MFAQIMVKVLGLVYKFVITNFDGFGDTGLGYYSSGYQIYTVLLALSSIGIPSVVAKLVSERVAVKDDKGAQRIFKICMTFFVGVGAILSLGLFFGADFIATTMFNVPDTKYVMQVLAPAITFVSASAVFRGYFAGLDDMKPTSYSQIIEQFLNCVLFPVFRRGGVPRPTGLANISPNLCPQIQKCRSRLLHLLRHFYLGVNGLGYSSLFRLWDYCRMPVFLSK